jgi:DNA polymerase I-like protein with 3'-5' exonuclease and polymerase domains
MPELTLSDLDFQIWIDLITNTELVGFDTETSGLLVYDQQDRMLGFSLAVKLDNGQFVGDYFPCQHMVLPGGIDHNLPEEAWRYLLWLATRKTLVIHNSIFDKMVVMNEGYVISKFIDTMKYDHLLNENYIKYDLDSVTLRRLGYAGKDKNPMFEMAKLAWGWDMPAEYIYDYAKADGIEALKAVYAQVEVAKKQNETKLNTYWSNTEAPSISALTFMRGWGVEIDTDICKREEEKGLAEKERITEFFGFNPGSPLGLKKLLIEELGLPVMYNKKKNKEGEIVTSQTFDKKAMERYEIILEGQDDRGENKEIVKELLSYRGWGKSVSSYYQPYQRLLSPDGRLRPEYKPHGTKTGRWSCADPNLQQIPKETDKVWNGAIKDCLVSASGYTGWEIDYSQLEFRLAASASHSDNLLEIFADPHRDIFTEMAKMLDWSRNACKTLTYSTLYGAGVTRIMDAFGVNQGEATDLIEHFYSIYPNLRAAGKAMSVNAARQGYVDIWSGRRRHFEFPKKESFKAFNSFIQGGAADIVKTVIIDCFKEVVNEECRLLLQVHDSLWLEIAEGKETYYLPKIMEIMSRPGPKFGVALPTDCHPWSKREALAIPESTKLALGLAA